MRLTLRSRFFWKLYAGYAVLILLSSTIVGLLISQRVEGDAGAEIRQSLEARAMLLTEPARPFLTKPSVLSFQNHIRALGKKIGTRFTVIRADGTVVADSDEHPSGMDNHRERPEVLDARSRGIGISIRFSDTLGAQMMYLALAVREQDVLLGYVRSSLPLSVIDRRLNALRRVVALGAGASGLAALFLGLLLTRHFLKPLADMTRVAELMSHGNYEKRLSTRRQDEIGELAQAFNRMADSCRLRTDTISADRNKLSAILSGMVEGVVAVDSQKRVIHLNQAAGKLLGVSPKEGFGKPIREIIRVREVSEILRTALQDETDKQGNLQLATLGKNQFIEMHASPLRDGQGALVGAVAVLQDVSTLHRLESVRREFVANASHELKTPITAIRGLVETLIDDKALPASTQERFLGKIKNQSIRLSSLVTDLLTLSRLESERHEWEEMPFDLREVLLDAAKTFVPGGEELDIKVDIQVQDVSMELRGDGEALSQLVSNLLDNALKYTPRGGRVSARLLRQEDKAIIEVEDTGIGIAIKDRDRIFERFYRVDKARSRELGGTGLGLSIVKHIALVHGGHVTVDSRPGKGSTFRIFLPLASTTRHGTHSLTERS